MLRLRSLLSTVNTPSAIAMARHSVLATTRMDAYTHEHNIEIETPLQWVRDFHPLIQVWRQNPQLWQANQEWRQNNLLMYQWIQQRQNNQRILLWRQTNPMIQYWWNCVLYVNSGSDDSGSDDSGSDDSGSRNDSNTLTITTINACTIKVDGNRVTFEEFLAEKSIQGYEEGYLKGIVTDLGNAIFATMNKRMEQEGNSMPQEHLEALLTDGFWNRLISENEIVCKSTGSGIVYNLGKGFHKTVVRLVKNSRDSYTK